MTQRILILHPGAMGATIGLAAAAAGHDVAWVGADRGVRTHERAAAFTRYESLAAALAASDIAIAVCPPAAAPALADAVAESGFKGIYCDANAIAPATAAAIAQRIGAAGARYVDGGIIGPPAVTPGTTRLYVSGAAAATVARCFDGSALEAIPLGSGTTAASALKMTYAAWTKGSAALLLAVAALARAEGVEDALYREWSSSQAGLRDMLEHAAARDAPKAWRFAGEMDEIARTFADAALPPGFHEAAAAVFRTLEAFRDDDTPATAGRVIDAILCASR